MIIPFDNYNISVANYLWLPMGASILSILLFGFRAFTGVLLGYLVAALIIKGGFDMAYIIATWVKLLIVWRHLLLFG